MNFRNPNTQETELKQKAARTLEFDRVRLLMDQPFIGGILIRLNLVPVIDCRCPTAMTDGCRPTADIFQADFICRETVIPGFRLYLR